MLRCHHGDAGAQLVTLAVLALVRLVHQGRQHHCQVGLQVLATPCKADRCSVDVASFCSIGEGGRVVKGGCGRWGEGERWREEEERGGALLFFLLLFCFALCPSLLQSFLKTNVPAKNAQFVKSLKACVFNKFFTLLLECSKIIF